MFIVSRPTYANGLVADCANEIIYIEELFKEKQCCNRSKRAKFKGTMTKWPVQKQTHLNI